MFVCTVITGMLLTFTIAQSQNVELGKIDRGSQKPASILEQLGEQILGKTTTYLLGQALKELKLTAEKHLESVEEVVALIDQQAIEEDCIAFTCPSGFTKEADPGFIPSSNGCGSFGLHVDKDLLPDGAMENCCNEHDLCYDMCGADKDLCELHFKRCLHGVCNSHRDEWTPSKIIICNGVAKLMYTTTKAVGCRVFQDAQNQACRCVSTRSRSSDF